MPGNAGEGGRRVRVGIARVDHDRQAGRRRDLELAVEERPLHRARGEIVEVVEPGLPDRDGPRMAEQAPRARRSALLRASGLMRIDPEGGEDALLCRRRSRARRGTMRSPCRS